jgi:hypothetical protein
MRVAPRRLWKRSGLINLLAAAIMVTILAGLAFGLPAVDAALPDERPVPADRPYRIGAGVSVLPPAGAVIDLTRTRPADRRGTVVFVVGEVRYAITVQPSSSTLDEALARLRRRITATPGYRATGTEAAVTTDTGLIGRQGSYTAPDRGGRYATFLVDGLVIEVTVAGDGADRGPALAGIEASTRSIRYGVER